MQLKRAAGPGDAPFHLTQNPMAHSNNGIEDSQLSIDRTHDLCEIRAVSSDNAQAGYVIETINSLSFFDMEIDQDAAGLFCMQL